MKLILQANRSSTLTLAWKAVPGRRWTPPVRPTRAGRILRSLRRIAQWLVPAIAVVFLVSCRAGPAGTKRDEFFTSGSREADQRASQKMAKAEQLSGSGEGSGERGARREKASGGSTIIESTRPKIVTER